MLIIPLGHQLLLHRPNITPLNHVHAANLGFGLRPLLGIAVLARSLQPARHSAEQVRVPDPRDDDVTINGVELLARGCEAASGEEVVGRRVGELPSEELLECGREVVCEMAGGWGSRAAVMI
jgi:hypothetical protein